MIASSPEKRFYITQGKESESWMEIFKSVEENSFKTGNFFHFSFASSYVFTHLKNDADNFNITPIPEDNNYGYSYSYQDPDEEQYAFSFLRRASFSVSPSFLKGVEIGAAYKKLNEPYVFKKGKMNFADSLYSVELVSELDGEAYFGTVGYSAEVLKKVVLRFQAGAGKATMKFKQSLTGGFSYSGRQFPSLYPGRSGSYFSLLGAGEISYLYNENFSLGLSGDYVWINAPGFPAEPAYSIPARDMPFKTFSAGLVLGLHF